MSALLRRFQQMPFLWPGAAHTAIVLLFCSLVFTTLISLNPATTLPQVFRLVLGVCMFYALIAWARDNTRLRRLGYGLFLCGLALALIAPFSVNWLVYKIPFLPPALYRQFAVLFSDAIHPNVLAGYLLILLPLPLAALLFAWDDLKPRGRLLSGGVAAAMSLMLVLSQSRGAWLAAALGLPVLIGLRWRRLGLALAPLLIAGSALAGFYAPFRELFLTANSFASLASRQEAWQRAGFMLQDFPLGLGLGSFGEIADRFYPFFHTLPGEIPHAHNLWLQVAVDLGFPGLLAWSVIALAALAWAGKVFRAGRLTQNGWLAAWGAGLLCSQVVLLLHGLVDAVTWGIARPTPLVWVLWGMSAAAYRANVKPHPTKLSALAPVGLMLVWLLVFTFAGLRSAATVQALLALRPAQADGTCSLPASPELARLAAEQRIAFGGYLLSVGCPDAAASVLPVYDPQAPRAELAAYQWGRVAWARGDDLQAASWWKKVPAVNELLLLLAQDAMKKDVAAALRWFDAALRSASEPVQFVETLWAYEDAMREAGLNPEFRVRLAALRDEMGAGGGQGIRLEAERLFLLGDMSAAAAHFLQAIEAGMNDSETWNLLGYAYFQLNRLPEAEAAYRNALQAPIAIPSRRQWYLSQLARLLASQGRFSEALPFQQEAAQLSRYAAHWDFLSTLYAQLGDTTQARQACDQAYHLSREQESAPPLVCQR